MSFLSRIVDALTRPLRAILSAPLRLMSAPRRLFGLSLPVRIAIVVELLLLAIVVTSCVVFYQTADSAGGEHDLPRVAVFVVILLIVIPWIVYLAMRLWLEGETSSFPDIDDAWRAGMAALAGNGLDISSIPVFLLVGADDERRLKTLMDAADRSLSVQGTPTGPAALHWYANRDAIYLALTETCRLGELGRILDQQPPPQQLEASSPPSPGGAANPYTGTIVADRPADLAEYVPRQPADLDQPGAPSEASDTAAIYQTMMLGGDRPSGNMAGPPPAGSPSLSHDVAAEQTRRLEYVCQLLRRARQPVCAINGVLVLLPFTTLDRARNGGERIELQIGNALREDLAAIRRMLRLRVPVTALIVGMEHEAGFHELVRRVGVDSAVRHRFGKGSNVANPPADEQVEEQIEAVTRHACGAFEDWSYKLFREQGGLSKPGNSRLYQLLCKVRGDLCDRLVAILRSAYIDDPKVPAGDRESLLFSGCYFAATGDSTDTQAFLKSVFGKLQDENEQLEWTQDALAEESFYQRLTQVGLMLDLVLLVALVAAVVYYFRS